ncbi:MAG: EAL domain-containing protein [Pseudomonadales bacterium]|nr:EAL domain-containing protein [Pseudomonadales bacterium]
MSLRSKAFLAAFVVVSVFFLTSVGFWLFQHTKNSAAEESLQRLMSQTFAVTISQAEQSASKIVKQTKQQWQGPGSLDTALLESLSQRFQLDYVFIINELGQPHWSYFKNSEQLSSAQKNLLMKILFNQIRQISQLKNGVAYFEQEPLYVLADTLNASGDKVVAGFYLRTLFDGLEDAYGFTAKLAHDQRDHGEKLEEHLKGEVKLPGLISSPVSVWIKDNTLPTGSFTSLLILLAAVGGCLGVFLWWLWRVNFILRIQSLIDQAHEINTDQAYQKRIKLSGDDELTELVGHYNSVLSTLEYSYNLMVKSNLITTELISKVQANTEPGSEGNDAVAQQEADELKHSLDMVNRLSEAVDHGLLELYFQPVFDANHQEIIQLEALCRWLDSERGMIPPLDFIALAEKSGQMSGLTTHVIEQACESIKEFQDRWQDSFTVSINLSLSQFVQPNLSSLVSEAFKKYQIEPYQLEFEIKEHTVARDIDKAADIIANLHKLGVGICIDDFGLSKFSLMYLQRLPVSKIKLSKSFVDRLERNPKEAAFIDGIARFSKGLDVRVVAKGVQTEQQLYALEKIHMLDCQGYALARPMAKDQFIDWYKDR